MRCRAELGIPALVVLPPSQITVATSRPAGPSGRLIIENGFNRLAAINERKKNGPILDKRAFFCYL